MTTLDYINPYAWLMLLRRAFYKKGSLPSEKVDVPVISIGNLTVGGSGKTPITKLVAEYLGYELQLKPAIILRGYKRKSKGLLVVSDRKQILATTDDSGDEAQAFARELTGVMVICAEDRVQGAQEAIKRGANVILLDDGFQHLRLQRDCNILLVNEGSQGNVIPFGKNREPINAATDADIVLWMDDSSFHLPHKKDALVARATLRAKKLTLLSKETFELSAVGGKRILAVSSIAEPQRFHSLLQSLGAEVVAHALADHAEYSEEIMRSIYSHAKEAKCDLIITTTKDIVKSEKFYNDVTAPCPVCVLHIEYEIGDKEKFFEKIGSVMSLRGGL